MTTIKLKNGSGAPTAGDLVQGEPALDLTNKRLYTEDSGGTVIEVGTNPTSVTTGDITATGTATFAGLTTTADVSFGDNNKAVFGAGSDLQIYHDASDSIINDNGAGSLKLQQGGSTKLEVTATGIDVTGTMQSDAVVSDGVATVRVSGAGSTAEALTIYNTDGASNNSQVQVYFGANDYDTTGRGLRIDAGRDSGADGIATFYAVDQAEHSDYEAIKILTDGGVTLSYLGSNKLATTSTGIDITGTAVTDGLTVDTAIATSTASFRATTNSTTIGQKIGSLDFFNGTTNAAGTLEVRRASGGNAYSDMALMASANGNRSNQLLLSTNGDISFYEDTGTTAKFFWDASAESLGIGTDSPSSSLTTKTDSGVLVTDASGLRQIEIVPPQTINSFVGEVGTRSSHPLVFNTVNAERMRIDSSGNLLVGTTLTPTSLNSTSSEEGMAIGGDGLVVIANSGQSPLVLNRLSSDGNVLNINKDGTTVGSIGTLNSALTIGTGDVGVQFNADVNAIMPHNITTGANVDASIDIGYSSGGTNRRFKDLYLSGGLRGDTTFKNNAGTTEYARFDSSGNLLVGKTSTSIDDAGIALRSADVIQVTRDGDKPLELNRLNSNGTIAAFYKDGGSPVGIIGTDSNGQLVIGEGDTGLGFQSNNDALIPRNTSGAARDGAINLGTSGARFKDLYLSGGAYLGGTGSANKLDDYEEGTFTPELRDATSGGNTATTTHKHGLYTKVGSLVTIWMHFRNIDTTGMTSGNPIYITGLPFTAGNNLYTSSAVSTDRVSFSGNYLTFAVIENDAYGQLSIITSNAQDASLLVSAIDGTGSDIQAICVQYRTD